MRLRDDREEVIKRMTISCREDCEQKWNLKGQWIGNRSEESNPGRQVVESDLASMRMWTDLMRKKTEDRNQKERKVDWKCQWSQEAGGEDGERKKTSTDLNRKLIEKIKIIRFYLTHRKN